MLSLTIVMKTHLSIGEWANFSGHQPDMRIPIDSWSRIHTLHLNITSTQTSPDTEATTAETRRGTKCCCTLGVAMGNFTTGDQKSKVTCFWVFNNPSSTGKTSKTII